MENSVEALKMAGAVLIFVLAISITISAFTNAAQALNRIFQLQEEEEYVKDADGNYLNFVQYKLDGGTREVGVETIIPSIYRAYKENYAIYFYNKDGTELVIYEKNGIQSNYIDLLKEQESYGAIVNLEEHINNILYEEEVQGVEGLYNYLKGKTFTEKLGEYYMDDIYGETETAEVNKTKKRVIAYQEI